MTSAARPPSPAPSIWVIASSKLRKRAPLGLGGHWLSPLYPSLLETGSRWAPSSEFRTQRMPGGHPGGGVTSAFPLHCSEQLFAGLHLGACWGRRWRNLSGWEGLPGGEPPEGISVFMEPGDRDLCFCKRRFPSWVATDVGAFDDGPTCPLFYPGGARISP